MTGLRDILAGLATMDVGTLREVWREQLGEPPPLRSADILRRALAEALQVEAAGGAIPLGARLARAAAEAPIGRQRRPAASSSGSTPVMVAVPVASRLPVLTRDWQGVRHQVEVRPDGYVWQGRTHKSLSSIARLITGVRWNGPRFFGLRKPPVPMPVPVPVPVPLPVAARVPGAVALAAAGAPACAPRRETLPA
ncbi:MAG: DUF2924 domain-containing protein [Brevundimonas sp.]|uniref:DUF2924 domain-containing protein n=1 Tax=Brevundimonas sp. TaxID=1871086 RepID=UPI0027322D3E|nr:DUF2924 domain-containing protein [Brevundimonas sp.]MDP3405228.1 DUF2924 domain-containing protein [Brevundimonas sp.]